MDSKLPPHFARIALAASLGCGITVIASCNKKPQPPPTPPAPTVSSQAASSSQSKPDPDYVSDMTQAGFDQAKAVLAMQVDGLLKQADSFKQLAAQYNDAALVAEVKQLEDKAMAAKTRLDSLKSSKADAKAIQIDIPHMVEDAVQHVGKAAELLQDAINRAASGG